VFSVRYLWHYGRGMAPPPAPPPRRRNIPVEVAAYAAADRWWRTRFPID
jgi:hypothetical protein